MFEGKTAERPLNKNLSKRKQQQQQQQQQSQPRTCNGHFTLKNSKFCFTVLKIVTIQILNNLSVRFGPGSKHYLSPKNEHIK